MPIRSPRGRAAAYRALWQWPLRSPLRLLVTVAVVVAVAVGVTIGISSLSGGEPRPPGPFAARSTTARPVPGTHAGTRSPTPTALPPVPDLEPSTLPLAQAPAAALDVASRWAAAWVRPPDGTAAQQWLDGLRPLTTDEYAGVLSGVDPGNIPATSVTGQPRPVLVATHSVKVEVPTDALTLVVLVVETPAGWRVAGYDRA